MGKSYCKVEKKWCKYLKRGICTISNSSIKLIDRCQRLRDIETTRLNDILKEVKFEDVFSRLTFWYLNQESSKEAYRGVFINIQNRKPLKHNLGDLFIDITKVLENDERYIEVVGKDPLRNTKKRYGLEFMSWDQWISMFITQNTLNTLTNEDIVAGCLFEMTFYGFNELQVQKELNKLEESVKNEKFKLIVV